MKLYKFLTIACILMVSASMAQTKMIAFKSHSGNMNNFIKAMHLPKMDLALHNLGMAPDPIIRNSQLDTVIFVSDSQAVMITSEYCQKSEWYYGGDTTADTEVKTVWHAGSDTVLNHPLFSHQHSLDSIKTEMSLNYYFRNNIENTVFIGFDNGSEKRMDTEPLNKDQNDIPIIGTPSQPGSGGLTLMLTAIVCISIFIGLIFWMFTEKSKQVALPA